MTKRKPTMPSTSFAIVYRTGGRARCQWTRILDMFSTAESAQPTRNQIERMGYKTLLVAVAALTNGTGMPVGWDSGTPIDYEDDVVRIGAISSSHIVLCHPSDNDL